MTTAILCLAEEYQLGDCRIRMLRDDASDLWVIEVFHGTTKVYVGSWRQFSLASDMFAHYVELARQQQQKEEGK